MCVAAAPARFTGTTVYVGSVNHERHGLVHVLGYQNTARNLTSGPNAMLLHLPAIGMQPNQFLDTSTCRHILDDMVSALRPKPRSLARFRGPVAAGRVQIFEHDIYTVILAEDPVAIPSSLQKIEKRKRIAENSELFAFYSKYSPKYPVALCCFDNADAARASPILLWYKPLHPNEFAAPAIDSHTGSAPDLSAHVLVDHWVIFGCDDALGTGVWYQDNPPDEVRPFLPRRVVGRQFSGKFPNGDFIGTKAGSESPTFLRRSPVKEVRMVDQVNPKPSRMEKLGRRFRQWLKRPKENSGAT